MEDYFSMEGGGGPGDNASNDGATHLLLRLVPIGLAPGAGESEKCQSLSCIDSLGPHGSWLTRLLHHGILQARTPWLKVSLLHPEKKQIICKRVEW